MKTNKKLSLTIKIISIIIFLLVLLLLTIWIFPHMTQLFNADKRALFIEKIKSYGAFGWFVVLGIQILQVIIALIPGEPIEIIAGLMYGGFLGLLTCLLGILLGSSVVFYLVKKIGYPLVNAFVSEEKISRYKFLNDTKRLQTITFILFLIPGTPKDALTYVAGLTKIEPVKFLIISTLARIPSIITSTFLGSSLGKGNIKIVVILFLVAGFLAVLGILIHKKIMSKSQKK